jgi:hypothetical protein
MLADNAKEFNKLKPGYLPRLLQKISRNDNGVALALAQIVMSSPPQFISYSQLTRVLTLGENRNN